MGWHGGYESTGWGSWVADDCGDGCTHTLVLDEQGWALISCTVRGAGVQVLAFLDDARHGLCASVGNLWGELPADEVVQAAVQVLAVVGEDRGPVPRAARRLIAQGQLVLVRRPRGLRPEPLVRIERPRGLLAAHVAQRGQAVR